MALANDYSLSWPVIYSSHPVTQIRASALKGLVPKSLSYLLLPLLSSLMPPPAWSLEFPRLTVPGTMCAPRVLESSPTAPESHSSKCQSWPKPFAAFLVSKSSWSDHGSMYLSPPFLRSLPLILNPTTPGCLVVHPFKQLHAHRADLHTSKLEPEPIT